MKIRVMIADDHAMLREGIKKLLEFDGDIEVVAEAGTGLECMDILESILPQVLLLDINMPDKSGLDVLQEIKERNMSVKVLILTVHNEIDYLLKAIDIGVDGYILKNAESAELKKAIYDVLDNNIYIQPDLIPLMNSKLISRDSDNEKLKSLTKREIEVLIAVANGMFNKEIAIELSISERTVKNHISNIFKKISVADRTQAAVFAIKNNLVKIH